MPEEFLNDMECMFATRTVGAPWVAMAWPKGHPRTAEVEQSHDSGVYLVIEATKLLETPYTIVLDRLSAPRLRKIVALDDWCYSLEGSGYRSAEARSTVELDCLKDRESLNTLGAGDEDQL